MLPIDPQSAVDRLLEFQATVRSALMASRSHQDLATVARDSLADTIYGIDTVVEPILEDFCREFAKTTPLILIAEGIEDDDGREGKKIFPSGTPEDSALIRLIVDPIDGTRGMMYDKRAAWGLAGIAPNRGVSTSLLDLEVSVMTEFPTSKMGHADTLYAIRGQGAHGKRVDLCNAAEKPLLLRPSQANTLEHGFASVSNFFPGTKVVASELMEYLVSNLVGRADVRQAAVFDDQYISTGGQFYELIVGHDRFIADLRPAFYKMLGEPEGLCCHPYDCASMLIAREAGVILTDAIGRELNAPLDVTTGISWVGYANQSLQNTVEPLIAKFLSEYCPDSP